MDNDFDDPILARRTYWSFWSTFARFFGLVTILMAIGLPHIAEAQSAPAGVRTASGVVCDTAEHMRRFVLAANHPAEFATLNAEQASSCTVMDAAFYVGNVDGTTVTKDGIWQITHVLIVGIRTNAGVQPIPPTLRWIAVAVASKEA